MQLEGRNLVEKDQSLWLSPFLGTASRKSTRISKVRQVHRRGGRGEKETAVRGKAESRKRKKDGQQQRTAKKKRRESNWGREAEETARKGEKCTGQRSAANGEATRGTRARPWEAQAALLARSPRRGARPPLTFQDEGVDVPVDAQEVALPPEARVGGEQRPATLGVQPSEPQQRAPGLWVCAPGATWEQSAPQGRRVPQRQVRQRHQAVLLIRGVGARATALAAFLVAPGVGLVPVIGEDGRDEQPQGAKAEAEAERRDERPRLHGFPGRRSRRWARRRRQTQCTWPRRSAARPPSPPPAPHSLPRQPARPPARLTPPR